MSRHVTKPDNMGDRADYGNSPSGHLLSVGREGVGWCHTLLCEDDRFALAAALLDVDPLGLRVALNGSEAEA